MDSNGARSVKRNQGWAVFLLIYIILIGIVLLPVILNPYPGMPDYPNHLARMSILTEWHRSSWLQQYYVLLGVPVPNMAMDIIVPVLYELGMELEIATRTFVGITIVVLVTGVSFLGYTISGSVPWASLLVFAFVYNRYFIWGFLNYFFGLGLVCWVLALWILLREIPWVKRLILFSTLNILLLYTHLMAIGIFGLALVGYELWRSARWCPWDYRGFLLSLSQFIIPLVLYIVIFQHGTGLQPIYNNILLSKIYGILGTFITYKTYNLYYEFIIMAGLMVFVIWGFRNGYLSMRREAGIIILPLILAFAILPWRMMGSWFLDRRLPIAALLLIIGFLSWNGPIRGRQAILAVGAMMAITALKAYVISWHWNKASLAFTDYRRSFSELDIGSRVFTFMGPSKDREEFPPVRHVAGLAVVDRDVFIPNLFAYPLDVETVAIRPSFVEVAYQSVHKYSHKPDWKMISINYDYVIAIGGAAIEQVPREFQPISRGQGFIIYRVKLVSSGPE